MTQKKRQLFQEVASQSASTPHVTGGLIDRAGGGARNAVRVWLVVLFALVVVMIAVGGLTRLTDSGLSITQWRPVTGALPPLSAEGWQAEFDRYRAIPQYELVNKGMTMAEFQIIYWWEWGHRQLGRVIGLVWAVGFVGFLVTRSMPAGWTGRLLGLGALGGLQGAIGWWMVASGLQDGMVSVASYRLATHLGLAFVILGLIAWFVFLLGRSAPALMTARRGLDPRLFASGTGLMHLAFLQILLGALVAGIDAGRSYTDWPLMGGEVFPSSAFVIEPLWRNFFENPGLVQFIHRTTGYVLLVFGIMVWLRGRRSANRATAGAFNLMALVLAGQIVLGIATVWFAAPWQLAIAHQALAVGLWVAILRARFLAQYPLPQSLRV